MSTRKPSSIERGDANEELATCLRIIAGVGTDGDHHWVISGDPCIKAEEKPLTWNKPKEGLGEFRSRLRDTAKISASFRIACLLNPDARKGERNASSLL